MNTLKYQLVFKYGVSHNLLMQMEESGRIIEPMAINYTKADFVLINELNDENIAMESEEETEECEPRCKLTATECRSEKAKLAGSILRLEHERSKIERERGYLQQFVQQKGLQTEYEMFLQEKEREHQEWLKRKEEEERAKEQHREMLDRYCAWSDKELENRIADIERSREEMRKRREMQ